MYGLVKNTYNSWRLKRKQCRLDRLLSKHALILNSGIIVEAMVDRAYEGEVFNAQWRIVYVQLTVTFADRTKAVFRTKSMIRGTLQMTENSPSVIKVLAGDLSQVILYF